jgi:hypothetical protein
MADTNGVYLKIFIGLGNMGVAGDLSGTISLEQCTGSRNQTGWFWELMGNFRCILSISNSMINVHIRWN